MKQRLLMLCMWTILSCYCALRAQEKEYMYEVGGGLGSSWTYGDVNRSSVLYDPGLAWNLQFRYNMNLRWAMAMDFGSSLLQGDSRDFDNAFALGQVMTFERHYYQFGFRPEFTFWNYGWGADYREKHRLAPFLTIGIGFGWADGKSSGEGRSSSMLTIPLGLGLKWKMAPRWDLQLTSLWSKTLGDGVDGISDPYQMGTTSPINTDWIGQLMLSVTFSFKERCLECHNQNE